MPDFIFGRETSPSGDGRFTARIEGVEGEAEITFTQIGPHQISADHTGAPDSLRGTGAAAALVAHMIRVARAEGVIIVPRCSYILAQYARHPEWHDVIALPAQDEGEA